MLKESCEHKYPNKNCFLASGYRVHNRKGLFLALNNAIGSYSQVDRVEPSESHQVFLSSKKITIFFFCEIISLLNTRGFIIDQSSSHSLLNHIKF